MANNQQRVLPDWTALPVDTFHAILRFCDQSDEQYNQGSVSSDDEEEYQQDLRNIRLVCTAWSNATNLYPAFRDTRDVTIYSGEIARMLQRFPNLQFLRVWIQEVQDPLNVIDLPETVQSLEVKTGRAGVTIHRLRQHQQDNKLHIHVSKEIDLPFCATEVQAKLAGTYNTNVNPAHEAHHFLQAEGLDIWPMPYILWTFQYTVQDNGQQLLLQLSPTLQHDFDIMHRLQTVQHTTIYDVFPVLQNIPAKAISLHARPLSYLPADWKITFLLEILQHTPNGMNVTVTNWDLQTTASSQPFPMDQLQSTEQLLGCTVTLTRRN